MTTQLGEAVRIGAWQPGSPEWHEARRTRIGGSEIAAILGFSQYKSHLSLWWEKKGMARDISASEGSEWAEWGNRLERPIFDKFVENHPVGEWAYQPGSFVSPQHDWQMATPDALSGSGTALVEIKTTQIEYEWGNPPDGNIPLGYRCQTLWNMSVTGADHCWLPVLIRGCIYREYLIERDDAAENDIAILIDAGQKFIQSLHDNQAPSIDGHDATYRTLREMHPAIENTDVEIPRDLADAYIAAVLEEKATKELKQRWAGEIMQLMGTARNAIDETGARIAYRKPASNPDRTPFLAADPALIRSLRPALTISGVS